MMTWWRSLLVTLLLLGLVAAGCAADGAWKTVYYKRGFVGNYDAGWAGGVGATLRMRVLMPCDATKVRVYARGCYDAETQLAKMALAKGADAEGAITADPQYPILFAGQPTLTLPPGLKEAVSDEIAAPITKGTWYLQESYASQKYPYAYDVDNEACEAGDQFTKTTLASKTNCHVGATYRIDVFTTDTRPTVLCYGDSITHGCNSTPDAGHRYPDYLATLLNRPTLNLGVNGDVITQTYFAPEIISSLPGVDTVVFLMGINDIIGNATFTKEQYIASLKHVIDGCHQSKLTIYVGTILPASGYQGFDADPAKETLRAAINSWIRTACPADGVIDFDAALADPKNPSKLLPDYQSRDWLHPSDAGYQKMADVAAKVLAKKR